MKRLEEKGTVKFLGWCEQGEGTRVKVWGFGPSTPHLEHATDLLTLALPLNVDDVLVDRRIPKEWRKQFDPDYIVRVGDKTFFGERDRSTESHDQIAGRMKKLEECPFPVLWVCDDEQRIEELKEQATDTHWFATFSQASTIPHEEIWTNRLGHTARLPERSAVQLDVQYNTTAEQRVAE